VAPHGQATDCAISGAISTNIGSYYTRSFDITRRVDELPVFWLWRLSL
jgi:hypothetical protein